MGRCGFGPPFRGGFAGGPRPATCYKCGGPNHYARDCQAQAMKCYACGKLVSSRARLCACVVTQQEQGHISRDCTAPNGGPLNTTGKVCYRCGQAGHISRDCTATDANGPVNAADSLAQVPPVVAAPPVA